MASCRLLGTDHTVLAAVLYFAVYLSSTGPVRTTFPTEPTTTPRPLHTRRNLLLGIGRIYLRRWSHLSYRIVCLDLSSKFVRGTYRENHAIRKGARSITSERGARSR